MQAEGISQHSNEILTRNLELERVLLKPGERYITNLGIPKGEDRVKFESGIITEYSDRFTDIRFSDQVVVSGEIIEGVRAAIEYNYLFPGAETWVGLIGTRITQSPS